MNKAVEMAGGDAKTLVAKGFFRKPPQLGKELLPGLVNSPGDWMDTECASVRHSRSSAAAGNFLQVRKASGCRGVLFRLQDLLVALPR